MRKKSQGLIEYIMVFIFAAIVMYAFAMRIDLKKIKNFAIFGIKKPNAETKITIPPMTD